MQYLILIVLSVAVYFAFNWVYEKYAATKIRDRILYGTRFYSENENRADLTAGDYGLSGSSLFIYHTTEFLRTPKGYLILFITTGAIVTLLASTFDVYFKSIWVTGILGGLIMLTITSFSIIRYKKQRKNLIREELPTALQLIAAIMESGMGFEASLNHVIDESDKTHPLYFELAVMNEAMQKGRRRQEALRLWAERSGEDSVIEAVSGLIQAEQTGASFGNVLKHHAKKLMQENESKMMQKAERLPVKMLLPMIICTLFPLLIVAAGPALLMVFKMFKDIMSKA